MEEDSVKSDQKIKYGTLLANLMYSQRKFRQLSKENSHYSDISTQRDDVAEFMEKCELGDYPGLVRLFQRNPDIDVNSVDALGRNALRLAIKNEHLEIVEFLLDRSKLSDIQQSALLSINLGHIQVAQCILTHRRYLHMWHQRRKIGADEYDFYQRASNPATEDNTSAGSGGLQQFSEDTTPIILAAQKNMYKIVQLLLDRGEVIQIPHKYNCQCTECMNRVKFDHLRAAKMRLNTYKGLASEAYITLSSKDPILRAFTLSKELRSMANTQKFFKKDYNTLAANLSNYVVSLLDQIQNQEELELIVNKVGKSNEENYEQFGRLKLALRYGEKKFVSHPSIQQKLDQTWYAGQHRLEHSALPHKILGIILIVVFYPVLLGSYLVKPKSRLGTIITYPCIKFICHSLSFAAFITLIILSTLEMSSHVENRLSHSLPEVYAQYARFRNTTGDAWYFGADFPLRRCSVQPMEMMLIVFIVGFIVQELQQIYEGGLCEYSYSYSNIMDFAMLSLYTMCFSLRFCILFKRQQSTNNLLHNQNGTIDFGDQFYTMYWLNADRYHWNKNDPENAAEALFAVANILSFARISYILPANATLGPLQISIGRMVKEILKFFLLFCLVLAAFIVGLQNLYWYYGIKEHLRVVPRNSTVKASISFGDFISTFRTAFWSLFGRGEPHAVQLGEYDNSFTEDVGYVIYGVYNIAMVTVLLNMLIAMMTRSFENIAIYSDAEWKFARSLLYMEYMDGSLTLPVPFNILTVLRAVFSVICSMLSRCKSALSCTSHSSDIADITSADDCNTAHTAATSVDIQMHRHHHHHHQKQKQQQQQQHRYHPHQQHGGGGVNESKIAHDNLSYEVTDENIVSHDQVEPRVKRLTYEGVIQRIVQRYICDVHHEKEVTEDEIEKLKQDINSFRYDVINRFNLVEEMQERTYEAVRGAEEDEEEEGKERGGEREEEGERRYDDDDHGDHYHDHDEEGRERWEAVAEGGRVWGERGGGRGGVDGSRSSGGSCGGGGGGAVGRRSERWGRRKSGNCSDGSNRTA